MCKVSEWSVNENIMKVEFPIFGGFCPTYGPKRKFRKSRVLDGGKKEKGLVFGEEWEWEAQTSCFSDVYMYITLIDTHRYLQINVFVEVRGAFCFFLYKKYDKEVQAPP